MVAIGPVSISSPFCQAGLAGYSDRAMRLVARRRGCAYAVTEALLDVILLNGGLGLKKSIDINDEDHPVAGQVIGSDADTVTPAAAFAANVPMKSGRSTRKRPAWTRMSMRSVAPSSMRSQSSTGIALRCG